MVFFCWGLAFSREYRIFVYMEADKGPTLQKDDKMSNAMTQTQIQNIITAFLDKFVSNDDRGVFEWTLKMRASRSTSSEFCVFMDNMIRSMA